MWIVCEVESSIIVNDQTIARQSALARFVSLYGIRQLAVLTSHLSRSKIHKRFVQGPLQSVLSNGPVSIQQSQSFTYFHAPTFVQILTVYVCLQNAWQRGHVMIHKVESSISSQVM